MAAGITKNQLSIYDFCTMKLLVSNQISTNISLNDIHSDRLLGLLCLAYHDQL
jgi:hypothetical protein